MQPPNSLQVRKSFKIFKKSITTELLYIFEHKMIVYKKFSSLTQISGVPKNVTFYHFFKDFLKNHVENFFEKLPLKIDVGHQF